MQFDRMVLEPLPRKVARVVLSADRSRDELMTDNLRDRVVAEQGTDEQLERLDLRQCPWVRTVAEVHEFDADGEPIHRMSPLLID